MIAVISCRLRRACGLTNGEFIGVRSDISRYGPPRSTSAPVARSSTEMSMALPDMCVAVFGIWATRVSRRLNRKAGSGVRPPSSQTTLRRITSNREGVRPMSFCIVRVR